MELNDYKKKGFLPFCIEEIRLAYKAGIDPKFIEKYMNDRDFDNMQLRQIRLGLEENLDVSAYARTSMPSDEMEQIRLRLHEEKENRDLEKEEKDKLEKQKVKGEVNRTRLHNTVSVLRIIMIIGVLALLAGAYLFGRRIYEAWNEDLYIVFTTETAVLEYKDPFVPEDYVEEYSQTDNIMIIYPSFSADELGDYTVIYQLSNGLKTIKKELRIRVVDTTPPVIRLKEEEIKLIRDVDQCDPEDYIKEISDNYDEDPKISIDELDWNLDEQKISFQVFDSSGNRAEAVLHVYIEDKSKEKPKPANSQSSASKPSSSGSIPSSGEDSNHGGGGGGSAPAPAEEEKVYCHSVTVPLGSDPGSAAYSTYDGLSGNITISIQYPELNTSMPGTYPVYYINTATGATVAVAYVTVTE